MQYKDRMDRRKCVVVLMFDIFTNYDRAEGAQFIAFLIFFLHQILKKLQGFETSDLGYFSDDAEHGLQRVHCTECVTW